MAIALTTDHNKHGYEALLHTQSAAIDALIAHFPTKKLEQVYPVNGNAIVGARFVGKDEEVEVQISFLGVLTRVGYSILTEADKEDGLSDDDAEWYDCTELDGLWEELDAVLIAAGLPKRRKTRRKAA